MAYSLPRDNWVRLVTAVVKKEQIWQLCHQNSFSTIVSDYSDVTLSFTRSVSSSSHQLPVINDSIIEDRKNASEFIPQKIFSALRRKKKPKDSDMPELSFVGVPEYEGLESFSLPELLVATGNFSKKYVIGRGAHGTVYKGRLKDGSVVAVKRLKQQVIELQLEMACLVMHRNVVKLIGFCITQDEQLLVYPFMEKGSVASCLRGTQPTLGWPIRNSIALGVANSLAYLHEECIRGIIHCDVKAGNILLDEDFQAVLSDFTLAKYMDSPDDGSVRGPIGHIATEYLYTHKCSEKADVFNYGIFLLELITGQNIHHLHQLANNDIKKFLDWVTPIQPMVDPSLEGNFVEEEVEKLFQLVLICALNDPDERPTMLEVVRMIDGVGYRWKDRLTYSFGRERYPWNGVPLLER